MDTGFITALAALTGTAVGGLTSVAASLLSHWQGLQHEKNRRQSLYCDFIEEASKRYIDAIKHDKSNVT